MSRIQRKRTKGWRMPENTVYVGRPTRFMNPFKLSKSGYIMAYIPAEDKWKKYSTTRGHDVAAIVSLYEYWMKSTDSILDYPYLPPDISELKGKDLACWCPLDQPCHADILITLSNLS